MRGMRRVLPLLILLTACGEPVDAGPPPPPAPDETTSPGPHPDPGPPPPDPGPDPEAMVRDAAARVVDGDFAGAADLMDELLAARPDLAEAHAWRAIAGLELGEPDAVEHADAAMDSGGLPHGVWVRLGDAFYTLGNPARSLGCYEAAFLLEPTDPDPMERAAMRAFATGEWDRAVGYAASALGLNPELVDARVARANALSRLERYAAAREDVTYLLEHVPASGGGGHDEPDTRELRRRLEELAAWLDEHLQR